MDLITVAPAPVYVHDPEMVEPIVRECLASDLLGVDTETMGKKYSNMTDQILVMGLSPSPRSRYLVPREYIPHFQEALASDCTKAFHNWKFDQHRFANMDVEVGGPIFDTMVMDFLYDEDTRENRHSLEACSNDYFNIPMAKYGELFGKEDARLIRPGHPLWSQYLDYGSLDPWVTANLARLLMKKLENIKLWADFDDYSMLQHYWAIEEPQLHTLYRMERRGIRVDTGILGEITVELRARMEEEARTITRLVGRPINPNSGPQLGEYLFDDLGLTPLGYTAGGKPQVVEAHLKKFAAKGVDVCKHILAWKKASKGISTYSEGLLKFIEKDGRIHTSYSPTKLTGRLGSAKPNLQNITRPDEDLEAASGVGRLRQAFIADDENSTLCVDDYAQLEMRVLAEACQDPTLVGGILKGLDMHSYTAAMMLGVDYNDYLVRLKKEKSDPKKYGIEYINTRQGAKNVGFGIVYGISKYGLAAQLSDKLKRPVTPDEAQATIDQYLTIYPGIRDYMSSRIHEARTQGYVQTIAGRMRRLSKAKHSQFKYRKHAENQAINAPIQGSAADIVKQAMVMIDNDAHFAELGWSLRLQIHDELVACGPKETAQEAGQIIQDYMEFPFMDDLVVPLPAEPGFGHNWAEAK